MKSKAAGFTLLELLLVISILSVLSSITMASLNTARDKASVAAGQQFSGQVYRSMGDNLMFDGSFNSDGTATDRSGSFSFLFGTVIASTIVPIGVGGTGNYTASFPNSTSNSLFFGANNAVSTNKFTISAWIRQRQAGGAWVSFGGYVININSYNSGPQIYVSGSNLACWQSSALAANIPIASIQNRNWHNVVCSSDGSKVTFYLDGKQIESNPGTMAGAVSFNLIALGDNANGNGPFSGLIYRPQVFQESLTASEVQKLYALGAVEHGLAVK